MTNGLCGDGDGLCVSVSLCVQIGLSWLKEGLSGGGDAAPLSINLCVIWACSTHTNTHTSLEILLFWNYFVINLNTVVLTCTRVDCVFIFSHHLDLCSVPRGELCITSV